ncbi:class I SAM-dependent methyltransferase [Treponema sp.]|uniref:class I SAM-dependent methyltransferase n=1 Tax=Treponema sp. TaxID=166 RepID=UPI00388E5D74
MILSVTFSKPVKNISEISGEEYTRIKIKLLTSSLSASKNENYFAEFYTQKQVFHKKMSEAELNDFIATHAGTTFKNCVQRTESEEITILANKKGKITELRKKINHELTRIKTDSSVKPPLGESVGNSAQKVKKYLLSEGVAVPFLVHLGVMTAEGKVVKAKYDKFRQINRFLEMLDDILDNVMQLREQENLPVNSENPLSIVDFGSGKSYLTFAVQYYLTEIKKIPAQIFGLDLKKDVIAYCNSLAQKLNLQNLSFAVGDIASFGENKHPDVIVTLHACDTATDYALDYAIKQKAKAILSVPCCQHEINSQLSAKSVPETSPFVPLLKYGLIKERFSALVTDAVRAELLESRGYKVQILEFIEESATPKNLLIRAVRTNKAETDCKSPLLSELQVNQTLTSICSKTLPSES